MHKGKTTAKPAVKTTVKHAAKTPETTPPVKK
jgi:hypothetical protein